MFQQFHPHKCFAGCLILLLFLISLASHADSSRDDDSSFFENGFAPRREYFTHGCAPTSAWIAGVTPLFSAKDHHFYIGQIVEKTIALLNDSREEQTYSFTWNSVLEGKEIASGEQSGAIATGQKIFFPIRFQLPKLQSSEKADGAITLLAKIEKYEHRDTFPFRVYVPLEPAGATLAYLTPLGKTKTLLQSLGYKLREWDGESMSDLVVVGREVFSSRHRFPESVEDFVRNGGRVLVFTQRPEWLRRTQKMRVSSHVSRQVFPVRADHPVTRDLDAEDLRDWNGESKMLPAYFETKSLNPNSGAPMRIPQGENVGGVASAAIEKPHRSSWRPILECEIDLAYSPLMELDYGKGRLLLCTLDLEDHALTDPAAARLTQRIVEYARSSSPPAKAGWVVLIGNEAGVERLDHLGLLFQESDQLDPQAELILIGPDAQVDEKLLLDYLEKGGKVFFLPCRKNQAAFSVVLEEVKAFAGSLTVPAWPECRGLSASDLHWRSVGDAWLIRSGAEIGAGGLLARFKHGKGTAIFCQIDPAALQAERFTYFRFTHWRQTRAFCQVLANLGARFKADALFFTPDRYNRNFGVRYSGMAFEEDTPEAFRKDSVGYYEPDYRNDEELGDDPYRDYRW